MARVLVVAHAPTDATEAVASAVVEGASTDELEGVEVVRRPALEAGVDDVLAADAVVLVTPVNFGYMSGALKHFFDSTYNDLRDRTTGLPFAAVVKGTTDATGAVRAVEAITTGLKWSPVRPTLAHEGDVDDAFLEACWEVGAVVAATAAEAEA